MNEKVPLTREDFEHTPCACCGGECHGPIEMTPICHPNAGLRAEYVSQTGVLSLFCMRCKKLIVAVRVASQPDVQAFSA